MTREEQDLLIKDLCTRLPYNVILGTIDNDGSLPNEWQIMHYNLITEDFKVENCYKNADKSIDVRYIRPYLFPLSSMTEEQEEEYLRLCGIRVFPNIFLIDWLNKNHFDYRGLIPMGLAIDATNLNIY